MERVELSTLYPYRENETPEAWTNRVLSVAREHGTYRQCSIGWHEECSQRELGADAQCACLCHAEEAETYTVEGHAEGGMVTVTRSALGQQDWPEQPGEPESMWGWWLLGLSLEDAEKRAVQKQTRILQERDGWYKV